MEATLSKMFFLPCQQGSSPKELKETIHLFVSKIFLIIVKLFYKQTLCLGTQTESPNYCLPLKRCYKSTKCTHFPRSDPYLMYNRRLQHHSDEQRTLVKWRFPSLWRGTHSELALFHYTGS